MRRLTQFLLRRIRLPEPLQVPWSLTLAIVLVILYLVVQLLAIVFSATLFDVSPDELNSLDAEVLVVANILASALMAILLVQYLGNALRRARVEKAVEGDASLLDLLALREINVQSFWASLFAALSAAFLLDTIGLIAGVADTSLPTPIRGVTLDDTLPFVGAVAVIVILRPVVEEILFRGILYPVLLREMAELQAIGLGAVIFAGVHYVTDPEFIWWGFVQPLVIGLVAGIARAATKQTQTAIVAHAMFGLFVMLRAILTG